MNKLLRRFEKIVRKSPAAAAAAVPAEGPEHPFDERNIHPEIAKVCLKLFDDGHYSQATFEVYKYLDNLVKKVAGLSDSGHALMMDAFNEKNAKIRLTDMVTVSEKDEQYGYRFIFAGSMSAIRNPRGHETLTDPIDLCLDHLSFASMLLRRLEQRKAP